MADRDQMLLVDTPPPSVARAAPAPSPLPLPKRSPAARRGARP
ncbi:MAG: hypothetical protein R3A52_06595 [Polyangiales bacterium]